MLHTNLYQQLQIRFADQMSLFLGIVIPETRIVSRIAGVGFGKGSRVRRAKDKTVNQAALSDGGEGSSGEWERVLVGGEPEAGVGKGVGYLGYR